jgi:hypothetical protein
MNSPYLLKEMMSKMGGPAKELRVDRAESPVKEIWSRLSFFESEYNSKEFLKKFSLADDDLGNVARNLLSQCELQENTMKPPTERLSLPNLFLSSMG